METISEFIKTFESSRDQYLRVEKQVKTLCKEKLRGQKVEFLWQSRVKAAGSLANKLHDRKDSHKYKTDADNIADIKDLAGARILYLRPGDVRLVEQMVRENFDLRDQTQHPKSDLVPSQARFRGYDGHHFYVTRRAPADEVHRDLIIEIQVIAVVMWAWATYNHDIEYKVLTGKQPKSVHSALEGLLGLANVTAVNIELVEELLSSDSKSPLSQQQDANPNTAMDIREFLLDNKHNLQDKSSKSLGQADIDERTSFLKWISHNDFDADQQTILEKRWPGTGTWLHQHYDFEEWFLSPKSRVLWCNGTPGAGKSVLNSIVVEYISNRYAQDDNVGLAFAYFRYDSVDAQKPEHIITAFIKQLCRRRGSVPEQLLDSFHLHSRNDTRPKFQDYVEQFDIIIRSFTQVFVIIDALDECKEESRRLILDLIWDAKRKFPCIKFFVTSRPEEEITSFFAELRVSVIRVEAKKDIETYLSGRLHQLLRPSRPNGKPRAQRLRIQDPAMKDKIFLALVTHADGHFLWAKLQLDNLCLQKNEKDIKKELYSLPKGLHGTYSRIVDQIEEQSESLRILASKCLMWVLNARRPLTLFELRDAVAADENHVTGQDLVNVKHDYTMADLMECCRNLLVSEDPLHCDNLDGRAAVRPLHYTVQKFFDQRSTSSLGGQRYLSQDGPPIEAEMAKICVTYLELVCLNNGPGESFDDVSALLTGEHYPLAWYCARYFDEHLIGAPTMTPDLLGRVTHLLSKGHQALAAILQLRLQGRPISKENFEKLDWPVNARTIIVFTRLYEIPSLRQNTEWSDLKIHPYALHQACTNRFDVGVKRLLDMGHDPNIEDGSKKTPLSIAVKRNDLQSARLLLERGALPNKETQENWPAIGMAALTGNTELVKLLIEFDVDVNCEGSKRASALYMATRNDHEQVAKLLLDNGARAGVDAFVEAAENGNQELVNLLLDHGVDINATSYEDQKDLYAASLHGREDEWSSHARNQDDLAFVAGEFDDDSVGSPGTALQKAARNGYLNAVELLLKIGEGSQVMGPEDSPLLVDAAASGHEQLVGLLLQNGTDPDQQDIWGNTAVLAAIFHGPHPQIVEMLLQAGANVNAKGRGSPYSLSVTPLHLACSIGSLKITRLLIHRGADVNSSGWVSIDEPAIGRGCTSRNAKRTTLQAACVLNPPKWGSSWSGKIEIIRELLRAGSDINAHDEQGYTALEVACGLEEASDEALQTVKLLLASGADANAKGFYYSSALDGIVFKGSQCAILILFRQDVVRIMCVSSPFGKSDSSPLHRASFMGHEGVVDVLLGAGADVHAKRCLGTPLEAALVGYSRNYPRKGGWGKVIRLLRDRGATETKDDCHYGVRCDGPLCNKQRESHFARHCPDATPEQWIMGVRYKCVCRVYNLCANCKDSIGSEGCSDAKDYSDDCFDDGSDDGFDGGSDGGVDDGSDDSTGKHRSSHRLIEHVVREHLGKEETLGET